VNYTLAYANGSLTVAKANATVTASSDTYIYNGLARTASGFTASGLVNGETASVLTSVSVAGGGTNAGTYSVTASGSAVNYNLAFVAGTMTINKASAFVTASSDQYIYNGLAQLPSGFTASGLVNGETASVLTSISLAGGGTDVGSYATSASGTDRNYNLTFTSGTMAIGRANATVTASERTVVQGKSLTLGSSDFTTSGLAAGQFISAVDLQYNGQAIVPGTLAVGSYPSVIAPVSILSYGGGFSAANYNIVFVAGALSVSRDNSATPTLWYPHLAANWGNGLLMRSVSLTSTSVAEWRVFVPQADGAVTQGSFTITLATPALNPSAPAVLPVGRAVSIDYGLDTSARVRSAYVDFGSSFDPGRMRLEMDKNISVQAAFDQANGRISLSGLAPVEEYNEAIRSIRIRLLEPARSKTIQLKVGLIDASGREQARVLVFQAADAPAVEAEQVQIIPDKRAERGLVAPPGPSSIEAPREFSALSPVVISTGRFSSAPLSQSFSSLSNLQ
jgi:hypothetical protein